MWSLEQCLSDAEICKSIGELIGRYLGDLVCEILTTAAAAELCGWSQSGQSSIPPGVKSRGYSSSCILRKLECFLN